MWNRRHIDVHQPTYEEKERSFHPPKQEKYRKKLKKNHPWLLEREMRGEFSESEYSIQRQLHLLLALERGDQEKKNP